MFRGTVFLFATMFCASANAQVENMPQNVQDLLAEVGPVWAQDIPGNIIKTAEVYGPLVRAAPKDGVRVVSDVSYGSDPLHKLDLYYKDQLENAPIVVFIHGGAYVSGSRNGSAEFSANIPSYFARHDVLGVNADYRLAPEASWPAGAEDVGGIVQWLKENAAQFGGNAERIYLMGFSAGATHVANYAFDRDLQPDAGPGIAGMILMSGRYRVAPEQGDPNLENVRAYFGEDPALYPTRSAITHIETAPRIPTFIVIAEYDNPGLDVLGAELFAALCARDEMCPRFSRLERHNHLSSIFHFNTADEELGRDILDFIQRGR